jgi:MFS family permease
VGAGRLGASARAVSAVVAEPQLRRAVLAFALACSGDWAFSVALGVVAFRDGGAPLVGLVAVLRMLPSAIGTPMLSAYADRVRRERVLVAVMVVRAVTIGGAAALLWLGHATAAVYALAVIAAVAFNLFRPTHSALLPSLCTTTMQLTSANVVRGLVESLATLVGPLIAGVLLAVSDAAAVFAAAVLSAAAAVVLLRLRPDVTVRSASTERPPRLTQDALDGFRAVARHPDLRLVFGAAFAQTCVRGALNVLIVVISFDLLDTGDSGVALLSAAFGAGGVIGALAASFLVGSRHLGRWLFIGLVLWGAPIAVIGAVPRLLVVVALVAVVGVANAVIDIPIFTMPVRLASHVVLARVFGVLESLIAIGVAIGAALTPLVIAELGPRGALVVTGALLPVLGVVAWPRLARLDQRLAVRDVEIDALRSTPMLQLLPVPIIEQLAARLRRVFVPAGTVLFRQGEPASSFYVIADGAFDIIGDDSVVRTAGAGECFGEIALMHDVPRTATVRARGDLVVVEVERTAFLEALADHAPTREAAQAAVATRLAHFRPSGDHGAP